MFTPHSLFRSAMAAIGCVAVSLCAVAAMQAQTVISSLPYTITAPGNYVLSGNLSSTQTYGNLIEIDASAVTLDLQNYRISGPANTIDQSTCCIYSYGNSNVTVRNGTIVNCAFGIVFQGDPASTNDNVNEQIDNVRVANCNIIGIDLEYAPSSRVTNCQLAQIGAPNSSATIGINVNGPAVTIQGNSISNISGTGGTATYCIYVDPGTFVRSNQLSGATFGVEGGIYQSNLADNCTTSFDGGVDGGNNAND